MTTSDPAVRSIHVLAPYNQLLVFSNEHRRPSPELLCEARAGRPHGRECITQIAQLSLPNTPSTSVTDKIS
jgi:hypothetical protein